MRKQGRLIPVEQFTERTYDPQTGWKASRQFEGELPHLMQMAVAYVNSAPQFVRVSLSPKEAGLGTLTVTFDGVGDGNKPPADPNGEPTPDADNWSLNGSDYEKDIWSHPSIVALSTSAASDYDWLRKNLPPIQKNGTWQDVIDSWGIYSWQDSATTLALFKMFRDGVEAYSVSQFVLRRSRGISSSATEDVEVGGVPTAGPSVSVSYVGYTFTLAQLISAEGLPSELRFGTPSTGRWLKRTPSIQFDAVTGKMQVENEYWHADDWNDILYPNR